MRKFCIFCFIVYWIKRMSFKYSIELTVAKSNIIKSPFCANIYGNIPQFRIAISHHHERTKPSSESGALIISLWINC